MKCPHCGSDKLVKAGKGMVSGYSVAQRYLCKVCRRSTTKPVMVKESRGAQR